MRTSGRSPLALFAGGPMLLPQPSGRFALALDAIAKTTRVNQRPAFCAGSCHREMG